MNYTRTILPNGLRLVLVPMKDNPTVTVLVMVEAGSKYETKDKNGLSHFLEHMCFKGTDKRPKAIDISRELDGIGAQYNAFTGEEYTGYYAKAHSSHVDKILDVVSDLYLNPIFRQDEVDREKGVIIEEINMYNDIPQHRAAELFMSLLYGDQPVGWGIAGTRETVSALRQEDFVEYRKNHYVASASTVIVAGDFDARKIEKYVREKFEKMQNGERHDKVKVTESQVAPSIKIEQRDIDQVHLVLGVRTFDTYEKKNSILRVLNSVLGGGMSGRLFQRMREELGICYYVHSSNNTFTDHGFLDISAGVDKTRVALAIEALCAELKKFKEETVSESELQKAKDFLVGNMFLGLESSDSNAMWFANQEIMHKPLKTADEIAQEIQAVTAEEIQAIAKEIFRNERLNLAIVGKVNEPGLVPFLKV